MAFHFSNDVFRQNFTFEATERILYGFALLQSNFCHAAPPPYTKSPRSGSLISDVSYRQFACHGVNSSQTWKIRATRQRDRRNCAQCPLIRAKIESLPALQRAGAVQPSRPRCPQRTSLASVDSFALLCPVVSAAACFLFGAL